MLKVAIPRPALDAVTRGDRRLLARRNFDDDVDERPFKPLTRAEAETFRREHPPLSPWRVVAAQVVLGIVAAAAAGLVAGKVGAVSALYGAAVVAVPGALMARGATSRLSSLSPAISAVSMLSWAFAKIALSIAMLVLAARIVPGVVWPALLASMVLCMQSYWFALLWRNR
ncbi:MAG TPA: ATP synthase subunit I [Caldimonas sp.]|nr:ATP synthase subunit I [Caldimonas sp.]